MTPTSDITVKLPRKYDVELLQRDLQVLRDVSRAPQPGPYHAGDWTGIALHSMGGKDSVFPSAAGTEHYQETENLKRTPYFKKVLEELKCPKEVVRILFLPPGAHIRDHFDFHTSFQFGLLRLHVPIMTNPGVDFIIDGQRMNWHEGELWYGDFSKVHSVKNNGETVRVHMVIDVQINDFLLSLFPEDFVARRRAEGISMTEEPMAVAESELRRYACDFKIPGELMPMFVIGKPLSAIARGCEASVRLINKKLMVLIDNVPSFQLEPVSREEASFAITGLPPGLTLRFERQDNVVRNVVLRLKGLPKDLYSARLGVMKGPALPEREVSIPVTNVMQNAVGSLS
ncbi:MAG: aspartyl/asparaginyl beta-hydroxylase domain-containing protein [Acidobacteriales bacterium]|nr:aspartyl/asparaginyl beta-hydroxylase domain-containing protein [Terriglobales bacterium]